MAEIVNITSLNLLSELINSLSPEINSRLSSILNLSKIAVIFFIIYIIVLIITKILSIRNSFYLRKIKENIEDITRKLDLILKNKRK